MDERKQEKNDQTGLFSARFSLAVSQSHLTQKELAKALNITEQTICRYKRGDRTPDIHDLCRLAKFFGVTVDWLLGSELSGNESIWQQRALTAEAKLATISDIIPLLEEFKSKLSKTISSG